MSRIRRVILDTSTLVNAGSLVTALSMDSYAPFPFLPPVQPGSFGGIYEFRTYQLYRLRKNSEFQRNWRKTPLRA
jgi:hypothetical protein